MPKQIKFSDFEEFRPGAVKAKRAFFHVGPKRCGKEVTVLETGETLTVPKGHRVEVIENDVNAVYFTDSSMTLSGPLVFWSKPAKMPGIMARFSMNFDYSLLASVLLMAIFMFFPLTIAFFVDSQIILGLAFLGLLIVFMLRLFVLLKFILKVRKVNHKFAADRLLLINSVARKMSAGLSTDKRPA